MKLIRHDDRYRSVGGVMSDPNGPARETWWPAVEILISASENAKSELDRDLLDRISVAGFDVKSAGAQWMADVLSG